MQVGPAEWSGHVLRQPSPLWSATTQRGNQTAALLGPFLLALPSLLSRGCALTITLTI